MPKLSGNIVCYKKVMLLYACTVALFLESNSAIYFKSRVGIFKQSIGARNRVGIGLSYRPAMLHSLAIGFLESILGLLKS
jgi:hypothetical protein